MFFIFLQGKRYIIMKNAFIALLIATLIFSCASDDDKARDIAYPVSQNVLGKWYMKHLL